MIVQAECVVVAGTPSTTPYEKVVGFSSGTLTKVTIRPAFGPNWEVYTRILHLEHPVIPNATNEWIPLERDMLVFNVHFTDWKGIYWMTLQLCYQTARFDHTVQYEFELDEQLTIAQLMGRMLGLGT